MVEDVDRSDELNHPAFLGGVNLLSRTGAGSFQIRCSAEDVPTVWIMVAQYANRPENMLEPTNGATPPLYFYEVGCGQGPLEAVMRLCQELITGGICNLCNRTIHFRIFNTVDVSELLDGPDPEVCVMAWNPTTEQFQPACLRGS